MKADLDELAIKDALETGNVVIRLIVKESGNKRGGLSVYGAKSGKYPMDLTIIFGMEE